MRRSDGGYQLFHSRGLGSAAFLTSSWLRAGPLGEP